MRVWEDRRHQSERVVRTGRPHVGHVLFLADVDDNVLVFRTGANDHALVDRLSGRDEKVAAFLRIVQAKERLCLHTRPGVWWKE